MFFDVVCDEFENGVCDVSLVSFICECVYVDCMLCSCLVLL